MKRLLILIIIAMSMQGCSKEMDVTYSDKSGKELSISVCTLELNLTRSQINTFVPGNVVGIFVTGVGYNRHIGRYSFDGQVWNPPTDVSERIMLTDREATVYGVYPGDAVLVPYVVGSSDKSNKVMVNIPSTENSFDGSYQTDYMYATAAYDKFSGQYPPATTSSKGGGSSVALYFHHALSKINFVINKSKEYVDKGILTGITLNAMTSSSYFCSGSGMMNVADGTIDISGHSSSLSFMGTASINDYKDAPSTSITASVLALPKSSTSDISVSLTIDGRTVTGTLPSSLISQWEAGKMYTYRVTISKGNVGLSIDSVSVEDWVNTIGGTYSVK